MILRRCLGQTGAFSDWKLFGESVTSRLTRIEFFRALDRIRLEGRTPEASLDAGMDVFDEFYQRTNIVPMSELILDRASQPLVFPLKTLDSIHLATALVWKDDNLDDLTLVTHDGPLARAAKAMGLAVLGVEKS